MPAPDAPPMSAAAMIAAATPRPTRRGFGEAGSDAPGAVPFGPPVIGTVGWVCVAWGPPKAGGTWPGWGAVAAAMGAGAACLVYWGAWYGCGAWPGS